MAVNVNIYSNANSSSKSVSVDFVGEISAFSNEHIYSPTNAGSVEYYFKIMVGLLSRRLAVEINGYQIQLVADYLITLYVVLSVKTRPNISVTRTSIV